MNNIIWRTDRPMAMHMQPTIINVESEAKSTETRYFRLASAHEPPHLRNKQTTGMPQAVRTWAQGYIHFGRQMHSTTLLAIRFVAAAGACFRCGVLVK